VARCHAAAARQKRHRRRLCHPAVASGRAAAFRASCLARRWCPRSDHRQSPSRVCGPTRAWQAGHGRSARGRTSILQGPGSETASFEREPSLRPRPDASASKDAGATFAKGRLLVESSPSGEMGPPHRDIIAPAFLLLRTVCRIVDPLHSVYRRLLLLRPRALNLVLAGWLSVSAFLFPHLPGQRVVSLLSGIAGVALAFMARRSVCGPSRGRRRGLLDHSFVLHLLAAPCDRVEQHCRRPWKRRWPWASCRRSSITSR
jgi:hypothetical protein